MALTGNFPTKTSKLKLSDFLYAKIVVLGDVEDDKA